MLNNIPAFPIQGHSTRNGQGFQLVMADGMTLRDYFAAKAMQGLLELSSKDKQQWTNKLIAETAYSMADAMLKARAA